MSTRDANARRGLSLLEVILAIAILAGCIAVIGELVRFGARQAEEARELTVGQLVCESKLDEVAAGIMPAESVSLAPCETDERWLYSIDVQPLADEGLIEVRVTVQQAEARLQPLTFSLVRWMLDPALAEEAAALEASGAASETSAEEASSGGTASSSTAGASSGASSSGSSGGTGGGNASR